MLWSPKTRFPQGFAEFSVLEKPGMKWRQEDPGGWQTYTASPNFVRWRLSSERPATEANPRLSFLRHQGIYCVSFPSIRRREGTGSVA